LMYARIVSVIEPSFSCAESRCVRLEGINDRGRLAKRRQED